MNTIKFRDGEVTLPSGKKEASKFIADMFYNSGAIADSAIEGDWETMYKFLSPKGLADTVHTTEIRPLLASSMEVIIREPVDPLMVISGLFDRVSAKGLEVQVLAGALGGAYYAADIPEQGTYPESFFQLGGALQTAYIGKSGIQASFTDEALRYSTWDIFRMNLTMMKQALVRHKETKAAAFLSTLGTKLFDNAAPTSSLFGVCTGRAMDMTANGSMTMDDLLKGMAHMGEEGFPVRTMLVNPLFYMQFVQDQVLRNMMLQHGGGQWLNPWSGETGPRDPWSNGSMGGLGISPGNRVTPMGAATGETPTGIAGREHGMTSAFPMPGYFPFPFRVITSPLVPFDAESQLGDIYLISDGNVGYYLVDEEATQVSWRDESVDVARLKIRERYGYGLKYEGQGVGVMKNVKLARNYWDGSVHTQADAPTSEIAADADVL